MLLILLIKLFINYSFVLSLNFYKYKWNLKVKLEINEKKMYNNKENEALIYLINNFEEKINWNKISFLMKEKFNIDRNSNQCRERYYNNLNPNLNNKKWNFSENIKLLELFNIHGNKWSYFCNFFIFKNQKNIKNHFLGLIKICLRKINIYSTNKKKLNYQILNINSLTLLKFLDKKFVKSQNINYFSNIFSQIFENFIYNKNQINSKNEILDIKFNELLESLLEFNEIILNLKKNKRELKFKNNKNSKDKNSIDTYDSINLEFNSIELEVLNNKEKVFNIYDIFNDTINLENIEEDNIFDFLN